MTDFDISRGTAMRAIGALERMLGGEIRRLNLGVCGNLSEMGQVAGYTIVGRSSPSWTEFGGRHDYPIQEVGGVRYCELENKWEHPDSRGARMRLAKHVKTDLETYLSGL